MSGITDFSKLPLRAQILLRRAEDASGRMDGINRLAEQRQQLEQTMPGQVRLMEAAGKLSVGLARLEARIPRLCRPIERLREDLASLSGRLAGWADFQESTAPRGVWGARYNALIIGAGFSPGPLLEPAAASMWRIVRSVARLIQERSEPSVAETQGELLALEQAAGNLKVSSHRATELLRQMTLPAFRPDREVRRYRRDPDEFIRRGGAGQRTKCPEILLGSPARLRAAAARVD